MSHTVWTSPTFNAGTSFIVGSGIIDTSNIITTGGLSGNYTINWTPPRYDIGDKVTFKYYEDIRIKFAKGCIDSIYGNDYVISIIYPKRWRGNRLLIRSDAIIGRANDKKRKQE